ncbi:hypothetical protein L7F22_019001 [Adiantum nelumboides]|nr:hypothetical protein [Adiantum nelumboides]
MSVIDRYPNAAIDPPTLHGSQPAQVMLSCASRLEDEDKETLTQHTSKSSTFFYFLTFAPPIPNIIEQPTAFIRHPYSLYSFGCLFAILGGFSSFPVLDLIYGLYWSNRISGNASSNQIKDASNFAGIILLCAAIGCLIFVWLFQICFTMAASQLSTNLRHAYIASILSQDASYFDQHGAGEVATHAGKEVNAIRTSLGEKLGMTIFTTTILVCSLIIGFSVAARVTGFLFTVVPIIFAIFGLLGYASELVGGPALRLEGRASTFLEEVIGSMRIVQSFGMAKALLQKYDQDLLGKVQKYSKQKALIRGAEAGLVYFLLFLTYSASFWWIGHLLVRGQVDLGNGLTAFWNLINSLFAFSLAVPHLASILEAMSAIRLLRAAIERKPRIDVRKKDGTRISTPNIKPEFVLQDVTLAYPSRPTIPSLKNVDLTLHSGHVTALVGPSGSGKSTITSLLLREYDPETANVPLPSDEKENEKMERLEKKKKKTNEKESLKDLEADTNSNSEKDGEGHQRSPVQGGGKVLFSGIDVRELNLRWLRSQVAIVRQNPQIFTASVFENVAAGLSGTQWAYRPDVDGKEDASEDDQIRTNMIREKVKIALQKSQAWDFVNRLPEGMDTPIAGGKTGLLSGGQRQRLSLARALVREPNVLVIDEGTSAIDTNTEEKIRLMLEEEHANRGMTTILIAHRLSTVEKADKIVVMRNGRVVDEGKHSELMKRKRGEDQTYKEMVMQQRAILQTENEDSTQPNSEKKSSDRDPSPISDRTESETGLEILSDQSTVKVAPSTIYPLHTDESQRSNELGNNKTIGRLSRRTSDHKFWTVSGRNLTLNQLEHNAEAPNSTKEMHKDSLRPTESEQKVVSSSSTKGSEDIIKAGKEAPTIPDRRAWRNFFKVLAMFRFEFVFGILGALLAGAIFPVVGWITGKAVNALNEPTSERIKSQSELWSLVFLCCAIAALIIITFQSFLLESGSEKMSRYLKTKSLDALLKQEIGFFDRAEASSGALAASVSTYPSNVSAATGLVTSQVLISLANLLGSVILAFVLSWKAALVTLSPVVVLFFSGYVNIAMLEKYESTLLEPAAQGASFISENVDAMKEVSALGRERETLRLFDEKTRSTTPKQTLYLILGGGGFAISQAAVFATSALIFYYGGLLRSKDQISITGIYAIFEAAIISIFAAGRIFQFTGDFGRAAAAFKSMSSWFERKPQIASLPTILSNDAIGVEKETLAHSIWTEKDIIFQNVELRYPRRPNHPAIRNLNLKIHAKKHQAFCGTSGSGKSTILQMVQRFYDPYLGTIHIGDLDIRQLALDEVRKGMSYVSQDACLYEGTIKFNLLLGAIEGQQVNDEELEQVCEDACISDFIHGLPDGYQTEIGSKGTQLSGGQRQRLCIARALIKKPKILLLDEATSALDAQAEVSVQKALDNASKGRTTLTVAHRLSTIRNADIIHVVEDGAIVESGSHDELIQKRGRYLELVQAQL